MTAETLSPEVAAEQAVFILKDLPLAIYGKTNFLIDWETEDPTSPGVLRDRLMKSGYANEDFWKIMFTQSDALDRTVVYGRGFTTVITRNADKGDPSQYPKQFESRYVNADAVKNRLPSDEHTDILFVDPENRYVEYMWTPTLLNLADPRLSRQGLRVIFPDSGVMQSYLDLVLPQMVNDPSFIFHHVLPKLFPKGFKPDLNTQNDTELINKIFDGWSLFRYIQYGCLNNVFDWSGKSTVLDKKITWNGIFSKLKSWGKEYYDRRMPIMSLLKQTVASLHIPFDQNYSGPQLEQQLKPQQENSITDAIIERIKTNPRPYLERIRYAATIKRAADANGIVVYNTDTGNIQTPQETIDSLGAS